MSFIYKGDISKTNSGRALQYALLADSTAFSVGEAVKFNGVTGTLVVWGAGGAGAGILTGFVKANGGPVTDNGAGGDFAGTYTTPASNTVLGVIDVSKTSLYSVPLDATAGTTTGSNKAGVNFDCVAGSDEIDENTVQGAGTTASFHSWGLDADVNAQDDAILVTIQESQIDI